MTAEARLLAQPVSFELASSSHAEGIEDRMTLAPLGAGTGRAHALVRERIPYCGEGDPLPHDLDPIVGLVRAGTLGA